MRGEQTNIPIHNSAYAKSLNLGGMNIVAVTHNAWHPSERSEQHNALVMRIHRLQCRSHKDLPPLSETQN